MVIPPSHSRQRCLSILLSVSGVFVTLCLHAIANKGNIPSTCVNICKIISLKCKIISLKRCVCLLPVAIFTPTTMRSMLSMYYDLVLPQTIIQINKVRIDDHNTLYHQGPTYGRYSLFHVKISYCNGDGL